MTTIYKDIDYRGYKFEFLPASQGFRLTVTKDGQSVYDYLMILQTQFEALMSASSEIFGESVEAETIAHTGNIPMRFFDDADCRDCEYFEHYEEMTKIDEYTYLCDDCAAKVGNETEGTN